MSQRLSLSIVMPVYNERRTIREILARVKAVARDKEIIIVDDGSTDGTRNILKSLADDPEIRIILQPENRGKGHALRTGFAEATRDVVIVQDADLEYDPGDYDRLLHPIETGRADVVYGSRFQHGERRVLYFWHTVANRFLTLLSNVFTNLNLTDMETCYKAFKRPIIQNLELESERFGFEPEVTAKLARLGCTIYEVPINYYGRTYAQGKKIGVRDGVAALGQIVRYSLTRRDFVRDREAIEAVMVEPPPEPNTGLSTLEAFEAARRYNHWLFSRFAPHVGRRVLEVGSGIGNIVHEVLRLRHVERIVATDREDESLAILRERFGDDERLEFVRWAAGEQRPEALAPGSFDTVICSNVLEHIEDDRAALEHMLELLEPGGRLLLLVPAHARLFCEIDRGLGHFRRYEREPLQRLVRRVGFAIEHVGWHNAMGIAGWWWSGKVKRDRELQARDVRRFDELVPALRPIDDALTAWFGGVSLVLIARRPLALPGARRDGDEENDEARVIDFAG